MRLIPLLLIMACWTPTNTTAGPGFTADPPTVLAAPVKEGQAVATFAGGCFWCMEASFEKLEGVLAVESGYTGGVIEGPTYRQVANHATQHLEAVRVIYDPNKTSYETMLRAFWHNIDPFDTAGQFCDKGHQYTAAIFVANPRERKLAEQSKKAAEKELGKKVPTPIHDHEPFWLAEDYHQDFYKKDPGRYYSYRLGCGRDRRLAQLWGDNAGH